MTKNFELVTGAELISRAAIDAGVDFFAGYPITPASSIYSAMLTKLQAQGKIALGVSDEISAISACVGASIRGAKSMTATSAPGLSLMIENLGYAFVTETPVLIALGQRLGPSTGAATQSAEGDISFIQSLISGGFTIPVIAPTSIFNCYETTINAINISEKFRCPVILLTEKDILMSTTNIDVDALKQVRERAIVTNRKYRSPDETKAFKTYDFNVLNEVPDFVAAGIGGEEQVVVTASFHDKAGRLSKNSPEAFEVFKHLRAKIEENIDEIGFYKLDLDPSSVPTPLYTIISFLAADLSAREAVKLARAKGIRVNHLTLYTLFPIPVKVIQQAIKNSTAIIVPEINYTGQYADIIRPYLCDEEGKLMTLIKINEIADLIKPEDILNSFY